MSKKGMIEYLYDISHQDDDKGMSTLDEQKLRKELKNNKKLASRNRDIFSNEEPKFHTCKMYNPCPLCDKCLNKASHLFVKCQNCNIPICVHTYKDREKMLKRHNFHIEVEDYVYNELIEISEKIMREK